MKQLISFNIFVLYKDRFTSGYKEPLADMSQDYTLTGFNESNGKTFLDFHRKRDTGDKRDIEIKVKLHNCFFLKLLLHEAFGFEKISDV